MISVDTGIVENSTPVAVLALNLAASAGETLRELTLHVNHPSWYDGTVDGGLFESLNTSATSGLHVYADNQSVGVNGRFDAADTLVAVDGIIEDGWGGFGYGYGYGYSTVTISFTAGVQIPQHDGPTADHQFRGADFFVVIRTNDLFDGGDAIPFTVEIPASNAIVYTGDGIDGGDAVPGNINPVETGALWGVDISPGDTFQTVETVDRDDNGLLDAIRVTWGAGFEEESWGYGYGFGLNDNFSSMTGSVSVVDESGEEDYAYNVSSIRTCLPDEDNACSQGSYYDNVFYLLLDEREIATPDVWNAPDSDHLWWGDTGVTPVVTMTNNSTLRDASIGFRQPGPPYPGNPDITYVANPNDEEEHDWRDVTTYNLPGGALVSLDGLDGEGAETDDDAPPVMVRAETEDNNGNGHVDTLLVYFSEPVYVTDGENSPSGFPAFINVQSVPGGTPYVIPSGNYTATGVGNSGVWEASFDLTESDVFDTSVVLSFEYDDSRVSTHIRDAADLDVLEHTIQTVDRAAPVLVHATTRDGNANGYLDGVYVEFSEEIFVGTVEGEDLYVYHTYEQFCVDGYEVTGITAAFGEGIGFGYGSKRYLLDLAPGNTWDTGVTPDIDVGCEEEAYGVFDLQHEADVTAHLDDEDYDELEEIFGFWRNVNDMQFFDETLDRAKPILMEASTYDIDENGFIDRLWLRFSEPIGDGDTCEAVPENFSVVDGEYTYASDDGDCGWVDDEAWGYGYGDYLLELAERDTPDTDATPSVTIVLDGEELGVFDLVGNENDGQSFGAAEDRAAPRVYRIDYLDEVGTANGRIDAIDLHFSETVVGGSSVLRRHHVRLADVGDFTGAVAHGSDAEDFSNLFSVGSYTSLQVDFKTEATVVDTHDDSGDFEVAFRFNVDALVGYGYGYGWNLQDGEGNGTGERCDSWPYDCGPLFTEETEGQVEENLGHADVQDHAAPVVFSSETLDDDGDGFVDTMVVVWSEVLDETETNLKLAGSFDLEDEQYPDFTLVSVVRADDNAYVIEEGEPDVTDPRTVTTFTIEASEIDASNEYGDTDAEIEISLKSDQNVNDPDDNTHTSGTFPAFTSADRALPTLCTSDREGTKCDENRQFLDNDENGNVDQVALIFSEPIRALGDSGGVVAGSFAVSMDDDGPLYTAVTGVSHGGGTRDVTLTLEEFGDFLTNPLEGDTGKEYDVSFGYGYGSPVTPLTLFEDMAGNEQDEEGLLFDLQDYAAPAMGYGFTRDADWNGKIDGVCVPFSELLDPDTVYFEEDPEYGFDFEVDGYAVASVSAPNVEGACQSAVHYLIDLTEGSTPDTDATPDVSIQEDYEFLDDAGNVFDADSFTAGPLAAADGAAPAIVSFTYLDTDVPRDGRIDTMRVTFSEPAVAASVLRAADLSFDDVGDFTGAAFGGSTADLVAETVSSVDVPLGTEATVVDTHEDSGDIAVDTLSGSFVLQDAAGNTTTQTADVFGSEVVFGTVSHATFLDGAAPVIKSFTYLDEDADGKIDAFTVVFSEEVTDESVLRRNDLDFAYGYGYGDFAGAAFGAGDNVITTASATVKVTLGTEATAVDTHDDSGDLSIETQGDFSLKDAAGNENDGHYVQNQADYLDGAAPAIFSFTYRDVNVDGRIDAIRVTFTEEVVAGSSLAAADLSLTNVGAFTGASFGYGYGYGSTANLLADLVDPAANVSVPLGTHATVVDTHDDSGDLAISTVSNGAFLLKDADGNETDDGLVFRAQTQAVFVDGAAPVIKAFTYLDEDGDGRIDAFGVDFSETVVQHAQSVLCPNDLQLTSVGAFTGADFGDCDGNTITEDTANVVVDLGTPATVITTYTAPDSLAISTKEAFSLRDDAGNVNSTLGAQAQATFADGARPIFVSATTKDLNKDGTVDAVHLVFSESVDVTNGGEATNVPTMTLSASTGTAAFNNVEDASFEGVAELTLGVTVSSTANTALILSPVYVLAGDGSIKDAADNEMLDEKTVTGIDGARPVIVFRDPTSNTTGTTLDKSLVITFSEPMNKTDVQNDFSLNPGAGTLSFNWSEEDRTVTISHQLLFQRGTNYHIAFNDEPASAANGSNGVVDDTLEDITWSFVSLPQDHHQNVSSGGGGGGGGGGFVAAASCTLVSPTGGMAVMQGQTLSVAWQSSGSGISNVQIAYSTDGGVSWQPVASNAPNTGSHAWTVNAPVSANVLVRVDCRDANGGNLATATSSPFSVTEGQAGLITPNSPFYATPAHPVGSLVKAVGMPAVYYVDADATRRPFWNEQIFLTWFENFDTVIELPLEEISKYKMGKPMLPQPGTLLIKIQTDPKTYWIDPATGMARWLTSEDAALRVVGPDWNTRVIDIDPTMWASIAFGPDVE